MGLWQGLKELVSPSPARPDIVRGGAVTFADRVAPEMWAESFDHFELG